MNDEDGAPVKKYEQVRAHLLDLLRSHEFEVGHFVGSEQDIIDELGFSRNTVRRAVGDLVQAGVLQRKRGQGVFFAGFHTQPAQSSGIVGIVTHTIVDNIYPEIIQGIEDFAHERNYSVALSSTSFDTTKEQKALENLKGRNIEGLIIEPAYSSRLTEKSPIMLELSSLNIPVVFTNCHFPFLPCSAVTIDDFGVGYRAGRYLIRKGHRRIAFVYYKHSLAANQRAEGLRRMMSEAGLASEDYIDVPYTTGEEMHPAYIETCAFIDEHMGRLPDAVVYYNDQSALDAYPAYRERSIAIGEDISLMGFDDIGSARLVDPPLTTWAHPKYRLGRWAAEVLFDEMHQSQELRLPRTVLARPTLIERASVADARKRTEGDNETARVVAGEA